MISESTPGILPAKTVDLDRSSSNSSSSCCSRSGSSNSRSSNQTEDLVPQWVILPLEKNLPLCKIKGIPICEVSQGLIWGI